MSIKLKITKVCGEKSKWETCEFYSLTSTCLTAFSKKKKKKRAESATLRTAGPGQQKVSRH
jgi:hypothetical protein